MLFHPWVYLTPLDLLVQFVYSSSVDIAQSETGSALYTIVAKIQRIYLDDHIRSPIGAISAMLFKRFERVVCTFPLPENGMLFFERGLWAEVEAEFILLSLSLYSC